MAFDRKNLEGDYERRRIFALSQQLELFDRQDGASTVDKWNGELSHYLVSTGTLVTIPDPHSYVTDKFLQMIVADPKLRKFASSE